MKKIICLIITLLFFISCSSCGKENKKDNAVNSNNNIVNNQNIKNNNNNQSNLNNINNLNNQQNPDNNNISENNDKNQENVNNNQNIQNQTNLTNTQQNSNNITNNVQNNNQWIYPFECNEQGPPWQCETEKGIIQRISTDDEPASSDGDEWGFDISDRYIVWSYKLNEPVNNIKYSIIVYDRCACKMFDPLKEIIASLINPNKKWFSIPRISDTKIIYKKAIVDNLENIHRQYWVFNLETGENRMVTSEEGETDDGRDYNDINDNYVVWRDYKSMTANMGINIHNLQTNENQYIGTEISGGKGNVTISGDYVAFTGCWDGIDYCDVFLHQISTNITENITNSGGYGGDKVVTRFPAMNNKYLVWSDGRNSNGEVTPGYAKNYDIYMYNVETQHETQLTSTEYQEIDPIASDRYVAYLDGQGYEHENDWFIRQADLMVVDLQTNKKVRFDKGSYSGIWTCDTYDTPRIEGKYLIVKHLGRCEGMNWDTFFSDVYLIDLERIDWDSGVIGSPLEQ